MAKGPRTKRPAPPPRAEQTPAPPPGPAEAAASSEWPAPRVLFAASGLLIVFTLFMFVASAYGAAFSASQAIVQWGLGFVIVGGLIHPAIAIAVMSVLRLLWDGMTYPADNAYFTWGCIFIAVVWGVRVLLRGERLRAPVPTLLLAGFVGACAFAAFTTPVQYDTALRSLHLWVSYFALFFAVVNSLRSRAAFYVALGGLGAAFAAQAIFAVLHYEYVLSTVRDMLMKNPAMLREFFGTDQLTPELARRLERNRAFGTLLFPNALGAMLVLAFPFVLGLWLQLWTWHTTKAPHAANTFTARLAQWMTPIGLWVATALPAYLVLYLRGEIATGENIASVEWAYWLFVGILPAALFIAAIYWASRYGNAESWRRAGLLLLPVILVVALWALWLSRSRGAMLALVLALVFAALLLRIQRRGWPAWWPRRLQLGRAAMAASLLFIAAAPLWAQAPEAPATPPAADIAAPEPAATPAPPAPFAVPGPSTAITQEGQNLGLADLADLSTAALRTSYWWIALRMGLDNLFTGVGPGSYGEAFASYQYPGAGDAQEAHNDYLQVLAETGVFGLLFFLAFCGYFALAGAGLVLGAAPQRRWLLLGLYTGVIAFLAHSGVDFNFSNPSLVFPLLVLAGAFFAIAEFDRMPESASPPRLHHAALLPLLVLLALTFGSTYRVYQYDRLLSGDRWINLADRKTLEDRLQFLTAWNEAAIRLANDPQAKLPAFRARDLLLIFPPAAVPYQHQNGVFFNGPRIYQPGEPIPADAYYRITDSHWSLGAGLDHAENFAKEMEAVARSYPHDSYLANWLAMYYGEIFRGGIGLRKPLRQASLANSATDWARQAAERSPYGAGYQLNLGYAETRMAGFGAPEEVRKHLAAALEAYRLAAVRAPSQHNVLVNAAGALSYLADEARKQQANDLAQRLASEAATLQAQAEAVLRARWSAGLS